MGIQPFLSSLEGQPFIPSGGWKTLFPLGSATIASRWHIFVCSLVYREKDRYFKLCDKGNQAGLFLKTWFLQSEVAMGITYGCSKPG